MVFTTLDISQLKKVNDYENIHGVNPLYLITGKIDGFTEEKMEVNILFFTSEDEKKIVLKKDLSNGIKNKIETINGSKVGEYGKDFMKIKFDDDLPLNKLLNLQMLIILVRSIFEKDGKFYPQIYLNEYLYDL